METAPRKVTSRSGELLGRQFAGRIDRGARLRDHQLADFQFRHLGQQLADELVGLAAAGAVADADQRHLVPDAQGSERGERPRPVALGIERVDDGGVEQLARLGRDGDLHAGADAGVEAHGHARAGGGGEQQVLEVGGKDADGLGVGALLELAQQIGFQRGRELGLPGEARGVGQPLVRRPPFGRDAVGGHDGAHARMRLALGHDEIDVELQDVLVAAAQHGEDAVRGQVLGRLRELEIVGELLALGLLATDDRGGELARGPEFVPERTHELGVLGEFLHEDVPRALQRRAGVGDALLVIDVGLALGFGIERRVGQQRQGQRLKAGLAGDHRLGAALDLIGRIEIFQRHLGVGPGDGAGEFGRELALLLDALQHGRAPVLKLGEVAEPRLQGAQLRVVEPAGLLLAVARDERNGGALVQQRDRRHDLGERDVQLGGKPLRDGGHLVNGGLLGWPAASGNPYGDSSADAPRPLSPPHGRRRRSA